MLGTILTVLAGLVVVVLLLNIVLPATVQVTRTIEIAAPAERIYPHVDSPAEWPRWSAWNRRDPAMTITYSGPARGLGAEWSWVSKSQGSGGMRLTEVDPPRRVAYLLTFANGWKPSTGALTFTETGGRTTVAWSMEADFSGNPLTKIFGLIVPRMIGKDFDEGLANLKALVESR